MVYGDETRLRVYKGSNGRVLWDTDRPDGTTYDDSKMLDMTASFFYINGSPLAGMNDPHTAQEGTYFVSGFRGNGEPWVDPTTGLETKFPLSGDPVQGSGWIYTMLSSPKDWKS